MILGVNVRFPEIKAVEANDHSLAGSGPDAFE
jgi:hypothetical protein